MTSPLQNVPGIVREMTDCVSEYVFTDPLWLLTQSLSTISTLLNNVTFETNYGSLRPNMFSIHISNSAVAEKTVSWGMFFGKIFKRVEELTAINFNLCSGFTLAGLTQVLNDLQTQTQQRPFGLIRHDELSMLLKQVNNNDYQSDTLEILIHLHDGNEYVSVTKMDGRRKLPEATITFLALSTPALLRIRSDLNSGGSGGRFFYVIGDPPLLDSNDEGTRNKFHRNHNAISSDIESYAQRLANLHKCLVKVPSWKFVMDLEAQEYYTDRSIELRNKSIKFSQGKSNPIVATWAGRAMEKILKIVMITWFSENCNNITNNFDDFVQIYLTGKSTATIPVDVNMLKRANDLMLMYFEHTKKYAKVQHELLTEGDPAAVRTHEAEIEKIKETIRTKCDKNGEITQRELIRATKFKKREILEFTEGHPDFKLRVDGTSLLYSLEK